MASIRIKNGTTPGTPDPGKIEIFADSADGDKLKMIDDTGTVTDLSASAMTGGAIKTAYEAETKAFTDALFDKLALLNRRQVVYIKDRKTSGTHGGTATANTVHVRDLNYISNTDIATLLTNRFKILKAGTYRLRARGPANRTNSHQIFLYNYTGSAYVADMEGNSARNSTAASNSTDTDSVMSGEFTVASDNTEFEIRHWVQTARADYGLGYFANSGINPQSYEIYTSVELEKIG